MAMSNGTDYAKLRESLRKMPHISEDQIEQWINLQRLVDASDRYFQKNASSQALENLEKARKILKQQTFTLIFFGGTGAGKSTSINALLGRSLLPMGKVFAITGTVIRVEQSPEPGKRSLTLHYWSAEEFTELVRKICAQAKVDSFDIRNNGERDNALIAIRNLELEISQEARGETNEYLDILKDCITTYSLYKDRIENGELKERVFYPIDDTYQAWREEPPGLDKIDPIEAVREDGYKGKRQRQIRLIKSATFKIDNFADNSNLLMNGALRIIDVPGLGASMPLHEKITLEEMAREDAMIILVTSVGRLNDLKSLKSAEWIRDHRLLGLKGAELDNAASKVFLVINGVNDREAFETIHKAVENKATDIYKFVECISPNYWQKYQSRGGNRPYFMVMALPALYVQDPEHSPLEAKSEVEKVLKSFADHFGNVDKQLPLTEAAKAALLELSEIPRLRNALIDFVKNERVRSQLEEVSSRLSKALGELRRQCEMALEAKGLTPPFADNLKTVKKERYQHLLQQRERDLPNTISAAIKDLSSSSNNDEYFKRLLETTFRNVKETVEAAVLAEAGKMISEMGINRWDGRDLIYSDHIRNIDVIQLPDEVILHRIEMVMRETVSRCVPRVAEVVVTEFEKTLDGHQILKVLERTSYGQQYSYSLADNPSEQLSIEDAYRAIIKSVRDTFQHACQQAILFELLQPERFFTSYLNDGSPTGQEIRKAINNLNDTNHASKLIATMFAGIIGDLFNDGRLLAGLRRLFWLQATRAERDFNLRIVQPMMNYHRTNINSPGLLAAMETDLDPLSDFDALVEEWAGLKDLEATYLNSSAKVAMP